MCLCKQVVIVTYMNQAARHSAMADSATEQMQYGVQLVNRHLGSIRILSEMA